MIERVFVKRHEEFGCKLRGPNTRLPVVETHDSLKSQPNTAITSVTLLHGQSSGGEAGYIAAERSRNRA
jgi:hypothetical protein